MRLRGTHQARQAPLPDLGHGHRSSIHAVVIADVNGDDPLVLDQQLQRDPVRQIDGHRMYAVQLGAQGMQA